MEKSLEFIGSWVQIFKNRKITLIYEKCEISGQLRYLISKLEEQKLLGVTSFIRQILKIEKSNIY